MQHDELKIYTDGGARGNPGPSAAGVVIMTMDDKVVEEFGEYLGHQTNNFAEYTAISLALEHAKQYSPRRIWFYMDSQLAARQLNGQYKVKNPGLRPIFEAVKLHAQAFDVTFDHIPRAKNKLADKQVNLAIDKALGL